ncbi:Ferric siderophore transport system, biopolymer transport protein ExbB [Methylophaga thiooxydans]|uniref:Ferric siderophore transport system, biopolymer transport protein ExbB n=1 Tax=Methylophaga thiooxydans TaxID=392484 RepID=A0A0A0BH20_9GAMM|nr:MotA/TolQ/ExbB proton channel family protein [Methylophaga thiooxydans]KGM06409.1 Ferric siderophore transport system, biopolymer transport protein ExbB [Methylophaga thiooxydans]
MDPEVQATTIEDMLSEPALTGADLFMSKFQEFMQIGGPVVWILTGLSIIALTIILMKLWQFALMRPESSSHLDRVIDNWKQGESQQAIALLKHSRPVDELVLMSIKGLNSVNTELETLKEELDRVATLRLNQLRAYLRPLEVIATLSPLLGLLGTVLGMIVAFQQMETAGNQVDPSVLSGGIWQALLTTAVGLAVAIPVVMAHNWMERKVERIAALMNDTVTRVFTSAREPVLSQEDAAVRHAA